MNSSITQTECVSTSYERCAVFGATLVATEVHDSLICLHGPQGCVQAIREAAALQNRECEYSQTCMSQKDVILGGDRTLISHLRQSLQQYDFAGPTIVVSTCAPEIIGDNVANIIERVNPRLPVIGVSGGFRGDHNWAVNETLLQLVKKFADPYARTDHGLVNMIGDIGGSRHWRADVYEMKRLLERLGVQVNVLACNSTIKDISQVSSAGATVLLTPEIGRSAADYLEKIFDCKVIVPPFGPPLGIRGTEMWLKSVGSELNVAPNLLQEIFDQEENNIRSALRVGLKNMIFIEKTSELKGLPVAVVANGSSALAWARFLEEELEARLCLIAMRTAPEKEELDKSLMDYIQSVNGKIVLEEPSVEDVRRAFGATQPRLVLGSSIESELLTKFTQPPPFLHIANPNNQFVTINEVPYMGYRGVLYSTETILNLL